jgi:hypothetical protein
MGFLGEIFRTIFWPIIRDELVKFYVRLQTDATFKKEVEEVIHLTVNGTAEEKLNASAKLHEALRRR